MSRSSLLLRCLLLGLMPGCASSAMSGSSAPTASPGSDEVATAGVSKEERFAEYKDADSDKAMVSDDTAMAPTLEQAAPVRSAPTGGRGSGTVSIIAPAARPMIATVIISSTRVNPARRV